MLSHCDYIQKDSMLIVFGASMNQNQNFVKATHYTKTKCAKIKCT